MDRYANFAELARAEIEGRDYRIHVREGRTGFAIVAPHGGSIERGTMTLADAIAGTDHGFYCFEGIKPNGNWRLHLTSDHFDEPRALAGVRNAERVISIHGAAGWEEAIYVGGLDAELKDTLVEALVRCGLVAAPDPSPSRQGRGLTNICNRGRSGRGVQIEITKGLRRRMFARMLTQDRWVTTELFERCVAAVRTVLTRTR